MKKKPSTIFEGKGSSLHKEYVESVAPKKEKESVLKTIDMRLFIFNGNGTHKQFDFKHPASELKGFRNKNMEIGISLLVRKKLS